MILRYKIMHFYIRADILAAEKSAYTGHTN